jgi:hypothetical protein
VHARGRIHGADGKAIEHEPQGMPRPVLSGPLYGSLEFRFSY